MNKLVPNLRFSKYVANWEKKSISELVERISEQVTVDKKIKYQQIGIRSHGKGIFYKESVFGEQLGNKRVFWVKENLFILNIVFAWEQAIAKTSKNEIGFIASHRFPMYKPLEGKLDLEFIFQFFLSNKGKSLLELASPGGAGRNKTLGQSEFNKLKIFVPKLEEQLSISSFFSIIDKRLCQLEKKKKLLEMYKKSVIQKIFNRKIKFKNEKDEEYPVWDEMELGECLDYIQPTKYIVKSTEYDNKYETPVLTAGKTFILGYTDENEGIFAESLPVIIFDDFTTATKYVDFSFKVKSSAVKILVPKEKFNARYLFEAINNIKYFVGGHERHWISKYSQFHIPIPIEEEQNRISEFIMNLDLLISSQAKELKKLLEFKRGLVQQMFI